MTPELTGLARRAVACKGWRWMPGMLAWRTTHRGERVQVRIIDGMDRHAELADPRQAETTPSGSSLLASGYSVVDGWHRVEDLTPDLSDPATLGCLLALVRQAWGDPRLVAIYCEAAHPGQSEGWAVQTADNRLPVAGGDYPTEAEALVSALERAQ